MHPSAFEQMRLCVKRYMPNDRPYAVMDFGSCRTRGPRSSHSHLLRNHDCRITGVDVRPGKDVDIVMKKPYRIPVKARRFDVIMSGQTFEHIPFFWVSFLELARVLRPGGHIFITVPSRGHPHGGEDCWRYYPDGMRALAAFSKLQLREVFTDWPPTVDGRRHDYEGIERERHYWGDTVAVFRKPQRQRLTSPHLAIVRMVLVWWANRVGGLERTPRPKPWARRMQIEVRKVRFGSAPPGAASQRGMTSARADLPRPR